MDLRFRILGVIGLALTGLCHGLAFADNLDAAVQQRILGATFEVVQLKPPDGAVTYERDLPMDLIPYQQRIDKYRSIGTAFAIGPNRYVTAGHVLSVGQDSQYGPPALRDSAGTVYDIDKVVRYSDAQDFAEFSLKRTPSAEKVLPTAAPPPLNDAVFAVGNALGQGVVIRDGVYTSDTPEETNGRWKWLRFTAAASPGNSGGPLVDKNGNVIGIVLRKSESENLNYAAPIALVAAAPDTEALIDTRVNFKVPVLDTSEVIESHERVALPATLADFYSGMHKVLHAIIVRDNAQLLDHNKDRLFPNSTTSAALLTEVARSPFPRMIREGQDRNWAIVGPQVREARLDNNGIVRFGGFLFRLRAPDDVKLAALYADSKLYMDLMLRGGYSLNRRIGSATIKVTSLGKAQEEFTYTDAWGRTWQEKIWAIPYDDLYLVTMNLPTPEGYAAMFMVTRGGAKDALLEQQKILANFTYVTFEASLARWREYLPLKASQPKVFSGLDLSIDSDYRKLHVASKRLELNITPEVLPLTATTTLALNFGYYKDGSAVVWDVGGILVGENAEKNEFVEARRFVAPGASLPDNFQNNWKRLQAGDFPYNGVAADDKGGMKASVAVLPTGTGAGTAAVRYALTVRNEGAPGQDAMHAQLDALQKAFKDLEH
jgi:serine protease Do